MALLGSLIMPSAEAVLALVDDAPRRSDLRKLAVAPGKYALVVARDASHRAYGLVDVLSCEKRAPAELPAELPADAGGAAAPLQPAARGAAHCVVFGEPALFAEAVALSGGRGPTNVRKLTPEEHARLGAAPLATGDSAAATVAALRALAVPRPAGRAAKRPAAEAGAAPAAKKARAKKGSSAAASEVLEALAPAPKARAKAKAKAKEPVAPAEAAEAAGLLALAPQAKKRVKAAVGLPGDAAPGLKRRRPRAGQEAALLAESEASSSDLLRALDVAGASLLSSSKSSN